MYSVVVEVEEQPTCQAQEKFELVRPHHVDDRIDIILLRNECNEQAKKNHLLVPWQDTRNELSSSQRRSVVVCRNRRIDA